MTHSGRFIDDFLADSRSLLRTERAGRVCRAYEAATSTNALASQWAYEGAPDGAVVYAEYQTEGRGRLGRRWQALAGLNLMFSVVLRPTLPPDQWGMITIAASVAVAEAVDAFISPARTTIKWPNDLLLNDKKFCGMLLEGSWPSALRDPDAHVILGVGLNVNQDEFPGELEHRATSLLLETGYRIRRPDLYAAALNRLEKRIDEVSVSRQAVQQHYVARMPDLNEEVWLRFAESGEGVRGIVVGLDESGGLILKTDAGPRIFHAGEVTRSS